MVGGFMVGNMVGGLIDGPKDGLNVTMALGLGLGLGLTIGLMLGLKLTIGPTLGPTLGFKLMIGPMLGFDDAPALGLADATAVTVPAEGVGVLPVPESPDGELLACAVADANTVVVAYAVGSVVAASVGWAVFWPASTEA